MSVSSSDPLLHPQSSSALLSYDECSSPMPSAFSPHPVTFSPLHPVCRSPSVCSVTSSTAPLIPSDSQNPSHAANPSPSSPNSVMDSLSPETAFTSSSSLVPSSTAGSQATPHTRSLSTPHSSSQTPASVSRRLLRRFSSSSRLLAASLRPGTSSGLAQQQSHVAWSKGEGEGYESDAGWSGGSERRVRSVRSSSDWWKSVSNPTVDLRRRLHSLSPLNAHRQVQQQLPVARLSQSQAQQGGRDMKRRKQHLFVMCRADCGDVAGRHALRKQRQMKEGVQLSEWGKFQAYQVTHCTALHCTALHRTTLH